VSNRFDETQRPRENLPIVRRAAVARRYCEGSVELRKKSLLVLCEEAVRISR
jgi:hypothetical protein